MQHIFCPESRRPSQQLFNYKLDNLDAERMWPWNSNRIIWVPVEPPPQCTPEIPLCPKQWLRQTPLLHAPPAAGVHHARQVMLRAEAGAALPLCRIRRPCVASRPLTRFREEPYHAWILVGSAAAGLLISPGMPGPLGAARVITKIGVWEGPGSMSGPVPGLHEWSGGKGRGLQGQARNEYKALRLLMRSSLCVMRFGVQAPVCV